MFLSVNFALANMVLWSLFLKEQKENSAEYLQLHVVNLYNDDNHDFDIMRVIFYFVFTGFGGTTRRWSFTHCFVYCMYDNLAFTAENAICEVLKADSLQLTSFMDKLLWTSFETIEQKAVAKYKLPALYCSPICAAVLGKRLMH